MIDEYTFSNNEMMRQKMRQILSFRKTQKGMVYFEGRFSDFESAEKVCFGKGYEDDKIFVKVKKSAMAVKEGKACYERDGYLFYEKDYYLQLLAILYEVFLQYGELNVIDFGGSLGSTYFQNKDKLIKNIDKIEWNIVEQKHFVEWGKKVLEDNILKFYYNVNEVEKCNCVVFGGSLQYLENYKAILMQIVDKGVPYIVVDRVPVSNESWVSVEYVHEPIYEAVYPLYIMDEAALIKQFRDLGYVLDQKWMKEKDEVWQIENKVIKQKSFLFVKEEKKNADNA